MRCNIAAISSACILVLAAGRPVHGYAQPTGAGSAPGANEHSPSPPAGPAQPVPSAKWAETHAGLEEADTRDCIGCHDKMAGHSHPVDVDYAQASGRDPGGFRPIDRVRARGVVLRDGKVGCASCHSPTSPWAHFLAVPRELAKSRSTKGQLEVDESPGVAAPKGNAKSLPDGAEVNTRPLCESCHLKS